jgi:hypothetical protein
VPFLAGRGQGGRGMFGLGRVPNAPTFPNGIGSGTANDKAVGVTFSAPNFNGRTANYNI